MDERLQAAEFAARRHLLGLSLDELAALLKVHPRTVRSWESGRDQIPLRVRDELDGLDVDHATLASQYAARRRVLLPYDKADDLYAGRPRGWHVAAVSRAMAGGADVVPEWT